MSILYPDQPAEQSNAPLSTEEPPCFADLQLSRVVEAITSDRDYLKPHFFSMIRDSATISYRHDIYRDLESEDLARALGTFSYAVHTASKGTAEIRSRLESEYRYENNYMERGRLVDLADSYCGAISQLTDALQDLQPKSEGFMSFQKYLAQYADSSFFKELWHDAKEMRAQLAKVRYSMLIVENRIFVRKATDEPEYVDKVMELLKRFQATEQHTEKKERSERYAASLAAHIEAQVLDLVAEKNQETFSALDEFAVKYAGFIDETIARFVKDVQFYLSYGKYLAPLKEAGLAFCYPELSTDSTPAEIADSFDLALAQIAVKEGDQIVPNSYELNEPEQVVVVTGPNQGGKTTYARMIGQIHFLAALGCPVPGSRARIMLCDEVFTHFEREAGVADLMGSLKEDLVRMHAALQAATPRSLIIANEFLAATALKDAVSIGKEVLQQMLKIGCPVVWVTFADELAQGHPAIVSMMSTVLPDDPEVRTFQIVRKPPDGLAYAMHLAARHRLTFDEILRRFAS